MAHKVLLTVDGQSRTLLTYHHNYYRQKRKMKSFGAHDIFTAPLACDLRNGFCADDFEHFSEPLPQIFGGMFYVSFEATDKDDLFYHWMKNSEVLDGCIEFFRTEEEDDIPYQRIDFWDAFLVRIKEQTSQGAHPLIMECDISAAIVRINKDKDLTVRKPWYLSDIDEKPVDNNNEEQEKQKPKITKAYWEDRKTKEKIMEALSDQWVNLIIEFEAFSKGDKVNILIEGISGEQKNKQIQEKVKEEKGIIRIDKAFRFKGKTDIMREIKTTVNKDDNTCKVIIDSLKENNGGIWGIEKKIL